jgi:4-hydroxy-2-oxoheptanedioate aldolase
MINSGAEAARLVEATRYPPQGARSFGPTRANFSAGPGYAAEANGQILAFAMIETAEAMANLDEIVATPGLDGVYVGPADLTLGLTQGRLPPGFDREEPEMVEAIRAVLAAAKGAGLRAGLHCGGPDYAARAIGWGFDLVTLSNDVRLLAGAAEASVRRARTLLDEAGPAGAPTAGGY